MLLVLKNDRILFIVVRCNIIVMYIDDEESVETPVTTPVTFVAPRPPPRRIPPHLSVQRECTFACHLIQNLCSIKSLDLNITISYYTDGNNGVPVEQIQVQLPFHGESGEQNPQAIGMC